MGTVFGLLCVFFGTPHPVNAQVEEYELKAAFLLNFTRFIDWPDSEASSSQDPFVIGLFREDPFRDELSDLVEGETFGHRPIVVRVVEKAADAQTCDLVFIPVSADGTLKEILVATRGLPILTVGDSEEMASDGCMIAFGRRDKRIQLVVNRREVDAASLKFSSKLLRLCRLVE